MLNERQSSENDPLEQLLGSFAPGPIEIDRERLMFLAGVRAGEVAISNDAWERSPGLGERIWPALTIVSTAAALILAVVVWQRPERVVLVERDAVPSPSPQIPAPPQRRDDVVAPQIVDSPAAPIDPLANYVVQRDRVVRDGPDSMESTVVDGSPYIQRAAPTQRQLMQELPGELRRQVLQVDATPWWQPWVTSGDRS
jgi:hypothetical protein